MRLMGRKEDAPGPSQHGELFVPSAGLAAGECTWLGPSGAEDEMGENHVLALNKLGADGWLVVAVSDGPQGTRYVLSRPVPTPE
jgi:hypothetical protein